MTFQNQAPEELTKDECEELVALKEAINYNPSSVSPEKMELFTHLLVRSLGSRGESHCYLSK